MDLNHTLPQASEQGHLQLPQGLADVFFTMSQNEDKHIFHPWKTRGTE